MTRRVTITGGAGYVGGLVRAGLSAAGYEVRVFDRVRGPLLPLVRTRYFGTARSQLGRRVAREVHGAQRRAEPFFRRIGGIRPSGDEILDVRSRLAERFVGSDAVIHLAGIPHPYAPGTVEDDFRRINFDGSVNVCEAAEAAGVRRFVFASSMQVYRINDPFKIAQFPILETNPCPERSDGQTAYGLLKSEFERYLAERSVAGEARMSSVALRLEYPGFQSRTGDNLYVSTSIENVVLGFRAAVEAAKPDGFDVFNLCDPHVAPAIVDVQCYINERWPGIPNHTVGNESLVSIEKARSVLGFAPSPENTYLDQDVIW
jgi:nucleoside-diphosphate-sugar epimerase